MEKLNWKRILLLGLPIVFAVSLAITLAACMAEAGRDVGDSLFREEEESGGGDGGGGEEGDGSVEVGSEKSFSEGLAYTSLGDGACMLTGLGECRDTNVIVPAKSPSGEVVTAVGMSAFLGSSSVKTIILPEGIKSIGEYAFYESSIESVEIPSTVESIGAGAFASCRSLRSISVDVGNSRYSSLDGVLFSKDKSRLICYPSGKTEASYTVRLGVSVIESAAFLNCEHLEEIKYNGQKKDWDKIEIGANNTSLTSLTVKFLTSVK